MTENLRETLQRHSDNEILQVGNGMRLEKRQEYNNQPYKIVEFNKWYDDETQEIKVEDKGEVNLSKPEILAIADEVEIRDDRD
jgi:co-chaperonin GroES (HSP10)